MVHQVLDVGGSSLKWGDGDVVIFDTAIYSPLLGVDHLVRLRYIGFREADGGPESTALYIHMILAYN